MRANGIKIIILVLALCSSSWCQSVRFVVAGDSRGNGAGINEPILTEIVQAVLHEGVDFFVVPGDLVNGSAIPGVLESELLQWRSIVQPLYDAGVGVYPVRGNHDAYYLSAWNNVFSGPYALPPNGPPAESNLTFAVQYSHTLLIGLDNYVSLNRVNQPWLDSVLDDTDAQHIFTFGHSPAFKIRHNDCLDDYPTERDIFWNSLTAAGSRVYFCGHDHFYDHARLDDEDDFPGNDVHQYLVGTAGAPLRSDGSYDGNNGIWSPTRIHHERQFGYALVEVQNSVVTITWKHRQPDGSYGDGGDRWQYNVAGQCCLRRGDINHDGGSVIDVADLVSLVSYLYHDGPPPPCPEEADLDASGGPGDISDLTLLVRYMFQGGQAPDWCP